MSAGGPRAALAAEVAAAVAPATEAEQLALLPAPTRFEPGDGLGRHDQVQRAIARRDRGRPPGSRNLATRDVLDFIRKTVGDPALERAAWLRHTPESLALELGCTRLEAFDRLDRIHSELARLFYAPLAAVDGQGNVVPPFFNLTIGGGAVAGPGAQEPWKYLDGVAVETEQNQALADAPAPVSHPAVSHEDDK